MVSFSFGSLASYNSAICFTNVLMLGCLLWEKGTVKSLVDPRVVFSFEMGGGIGVMHLSAVGGNLDVCKYLVEELGGDVNAPAPGVGGNPITLSSSLEISISHVYVLSLLDV